MPRHDRSAEQILERVVDEWVLLVILAVARVEGDKTGAESDYRHAGIAVALFDAHVGFGFGFSHDAAESHQETIGLLCPKKEVADEQGPRQDVLPVRCEVTPTDHCQEHVAQHVAHLQHDAIDESRDEKQPLLDVSFAEVEVGAGTRLLGGRWWLVDLLLLVVVGC